MGGETGNMDLDECTAVLDEFFAMEETEPFHTAVDWKELGLYDYPQIIKKPMDLGAIREKLEGNKYKTNDEFVADMRLIWKNCMLYNEDGSDFHALAEELMEKLNERVEAIETPTEDVPDPTMEEKTRFSEDIHKIKSEDLGQVIHLLDEKCPTALEKTSADELDIVVDAIDGGAFQAVYKFIKSVMPKDTSGAVLSKTSKSAKKKKKEEGPKSKKQKTG